MSVRASLAGGGVGRGEYLLTLRDTMDEQQKTEKVASKPFERAVVHVWNIIHIPMPSLILYDGSVPM